MLSPETAADRALTVEEQEMLLGIPRIEAVGTPSQVGRRLAEIGSHFGADELMLVSGIYDPVSRIRSLEYIAGALRQQPIGI